MSATASRSSAVQSSSRTTGKATDGQDVLGRLIANAADRPEALDRLNEAGRARVLAALSRTPADEDQRHEGARAARSANQATFADHVWATQGDRREQAGASHPIGSGVVVAPITFALLAQPCIVRSPAPPLTCAFASSAEKACQDRAKSVPSVSAVEPLTLGFGFPPSSCSDGSPGSNRPTTSAATAQRAGINPGLDSQ